MKYILYLCLVLGISIDAFAADSSDDAKAIQENWKPVKAELAGAPMAADVLKSISLKLHDGKYEVFVGDKPDRGTYTLDTASKPKSMTITGTEGPNHDKTFPAIYELKGDTLRICYDLSGAQRPTEFKSIAGTKLYLVTYNRTKEQRLLSVSKTPNPTVPGKGASRLCSTLNAIPASCLSRNVSGCADMGTTPAGRCKWHSWFF